MGRNLPEVLVQSYAEEFGRQQRLKEVPRYTQVLFQEFLWIIMCFPGVNPKDSRICVFQCSCFKGR